MIPKSGNRFSDKIMRKWSESPDRLINQWTSQAAGLPANCRATSHGGQPAAVRLRKTRGLRGENAGTHVVTAASRRANARKDENRDARKRRRLKRVWIFPPIS